MEQKENIDTQNQDSTQSETQETQQTVQPENSAEATASAEASANEDASTEANADAAAEEAVKSPEEQLAEMQKQYDTLHNDYLRLMADFDNFRKRTIKEKQDLLKYGAEDSIKKLLPVIDDMERAMNAIDTASDINAVKEGIGHIFNKFKAYLDQNNVKEIPAAQGDAFDESKHDAMTMFPAPTPELKGKVVDCVTKGYTLNEKVIRYAKVVVGQ